MNKDDLIKLDSELGQYSILYNDIDVSYLIRNEIVSKLRSKENKGNKSIIINRQVIKRFVKSILRTFRNIFGDADYWVFSNAERRKLIGDIYYDRVGSIVSELNSATIFIENPVVVDHKKQVKDRIFSDSFFYLISYLYVKMFFDKRNIKNLDVIKEFENFYGIKIDYLDKIQRFIGQYKTMNFFLKFKKPKISFFVYPDGYCGYIYALKKNNIPVVELQHGIIYPSHPSYNCYLPQIFKKLKPDYIFTYGNKDLEVLKANRFLENGNNYYAVGSYMLWLYKNKNIPNSLYLEEILSRISSYNKIILVSCTANDFNKIIDYIKEVLQQISDCHFLVLPRLDLPKNYIVDKGMTVLDPGRTNVYELIKLCDIHVTISSTTALEALFFDKRSIILENELGSSFFRTNYPDLNSLEYAQNEDSFIQLLTTDSKTLNTDSICNYFENNTMDNFKRILTEISKHKC